jgi:ATP-binding cassette subfamily B protein
MAQGGHYAELYNTYFRHQSLDYIEQVGARRQAVQGADGRSHPAPLIPLSSHP